MRPRLSRMILNNSSGYGALAEFHDLFMSQTWQDLALPLHEEFGDLPADAVIADLGAGSGMGTRQLAHATSAHIAALEPDLVMRAILLARVADDRDLTQRVTVHAGAIPDGLDLLPQRVDGFVCAHMLGHLSVIERLELFTWLSEHLSPGAAGLVTLNPAPSEDADGEDVVEIRRVGGHEYRAIHVAAATPQTYTSRYEVWAGDGLVRAAEFAGTWQPVTFDDLHDLLAAGNLQIRRHSARLAIVHQPD